MLFNLEECGLDSGHGKRDWLNVVGRQSVAPGDQQYSITFYRKISSSSSSYLANSTSRTLSAFLCWIKARPWQGLDKCHILLEIQQSD